MSLTYVTYACISLEHNNLSLCIIVHQVFPDIRKSVCGNGGERCDDQRPCRLHPWLGQVSFCRVLACFYHVDGYRVVYINPCALSYRCKLNEHYVNTSDFLDAIKTNLDKTLGKWRTVRISEVICRFLACFYCPCVIRPCLSRFEGPKFLPVLPFLYSHSSQKHGCTQSLCLTCCHQSTFVLHN